MRHKLVSFLGISAMLGIIFISTGSAPVQAAKRPAPDPLIEAPKDRDARLKWWREARFGMFIHWGPVSLKGTEIGWSRGAQVPVEEYDKLYLSFNPTNFKAETWVKIAKAAGMKYLVLTTKHHDGFCLWNSKHTDYHIMHSPFKRDVAGELAAACRHQGIVFCTYHSICDWYHPDYPLGSPGGKTEKPNPNLERYVQYLKNQLAELVKNYGPLGVLWFDGEWEKPWNADLGEDLYRYLRAMQPNLIINNRVTKGRAGMAGTSPAAVFAGDYDTPEQTIGKYQDQRPWETCMTICQQWAWKPDDEMKSLKQCLRTLVLCAGGDGNLLFNVGPMPDGRIEPRQVERLLEMGAWLKKNGESIYGTRGGPYLPSRDLACTRKGKTIYLHVFAWEDDGPLTLPPLPKRVKSAKLLEHGIVELKQEPTGITVQVPLIFRDKIDTVIKLELAGSALDIPTVRTTPAAISESKRATASNIYQKQSSFGPSKAVDGDSHTRWATDRGVIQAWLEIDLGQPMAVGRVLIDEAFPGRIKRFELQYAQNGEWKTIFADISIGADYRHKFSPVTAQKFRLQILDATDGPTINELQLFPPGK